MLILLNSKLLLWGGGANKLTPIEKKTWISFFISDDKKNGLFNLRASSSGIDKNKLMSSYELEVPYITRSGINNGLSMFVGRKQHAKYNMDNGNVISIGLDTQTVYYQPYDFYTGQNVQVLHNDKLNKYNAMFLIPLIKKQVSKLSWGGNGATLGRLKRMKILLPVNSDNKPDYDYMEAYVKAIMYNRYNKYISLIA